MKITVKKSFRNLAEGLVYDFSDLPTFKRITIVGENGCGKSSILQALRGSIKDKKNTSLYRSDFISLADNVTIEHDYETIIFFDGVKDNGSDLMNGYDAVNYLEMGGMAAQRLSHGQGTLMYLNKFLSENKSKFIPDKTLLVFDEIDNGFSLGNQTKFNNFISNLAHVSRCNVLIVSHNPFFIKQSLIVYNFNKRDFDLSDDYLEEITGYSITKITKTDD